MKKSAVFAMTVILLWGNHIARGQNDDNVGRNTPIRLHPENPHYFQYKGKTKALITSAEHYGAVLNLDFDYNAYLETLAKEEMNYTRIFTGSYFEKPGDFNIEHNTLAPAKNRAITPWVRTSKASEPAMYDLSKFNDAYFKRLRDFMAAAEKKDIIVEVTLFSSIYQDATWDIVPQNPKNNINISDSPNRKDAQTINNGKLWEYQEKFVRKMVAELNNFNNFFFEIQNEPWSDNTESVLNLVNKEELVENDWQNKADFATAASLAWQKNISKLIAETEKDLPKKHLIAQNYSNYKAPIPEVDKKIDIINFHYAWPEAVAWNYHYDRVIGFDESGFAGSGDTVYRKQAWRFMLSGGGLFNNLDYSFYVGHEDGLGKNEAPGGGSKSLRKQLKTLSDFLHGFELERLRPNRTDVIAAPGLIPYILSDGKEAYAIYLQSVGTSSSALKLKTGNGTYRVSQLNTVTGNFAEATLMTAQEGILSIPISIPEGELALKLTR